MELKDIKKIVQMMSEHDLSEFSLENKEGSLRLKRGSTIVTQLASAPQTPVASIPTETSAVATAGEPAIENNSDEGLLEIKSPMVGTFYRASSPDIDAFVGVGQEVSSDTVVCIVEAMKVMNEIQAELTGKIKKILVENATPVQFGQVLFLVEPA